MSNSWETRKGFCFRGIVKDKTIKYTDFIFSKTGYPEYENAVNEEIEKIKSAISQGNKIIIDDDSIRVFEDDIILGKFVNRADSHKSFFNFV